ncbi:hypothetical protein, partial [Photobacterium damselae]
KVVVSRTAKIDLLNELIDEIKEEIEKKLNQNQTYEQLISQREKLDINIDRKLESLNETESSLELHSRKIKELSTELDENENRLNEVKVMIERFNLLDRQYSSDISRLENISEVGNLFIALPEDNCPLCGSVPLEDNEHNLYDGDVDRLV